MLGHSTRPFLTSGDGVYHFHGQKDRQTGGHAWWIVDRNSPENRMENMFILSSTCILYLKNST